ncbi:MAG: aryl-sulfate sulfotransferase [Bacteroidetes bacterium]|nr:aryl-sulfate sulfotransferase [Bacteroidota bacterium]MBU1719795.1 aryl-sulfate sulfotransferase [Bacteroidota bacterium]
MKKRILSFMLIFACLFGPLTISAQQWGLYTLYATKNGTKAYLIDTANTPATYKTWTFSSTKKSSYSTYLIYGDTLVRTYTNTSNVLTGGGMSGGIQKVAWDGTVTWDFQYSSSTYCSHHDICPMPNGNVLLISYDVRSAAEATQAGASANKIYWSDKIIEVRQTGPATGEIVWEWKLWDHLCQNYNSSKDNYVTSIVDNPQLSDINYTVNVPPFGTNIDYWHMNGIDYNEELDQIVVSAHMMNEAYVIDHSTTTAEAAGHTGGIYGKGGDFLYRWGNPAAYGATGTTDFNVIHDAHWVSSDNPNYPNYLCGYNNKGGTGGKTAVDVWNPPCTNGVYSLTPGSAYGPAAYDYRFNSTFSASNEGNSEQLPNGNMLVNNSFGNIYEVTSNGTQLWTKSSANSTHAYRFTKCQIRGPIVSADASQNPICLGESVTLTASAFSVTESSPSFTYEWSSLETTDIITATPTASTTYTVTVTDNSVGCSQTAEISVTVDPLPTQPVIAPSGSTLTSSSASQYQWYLDGNPVAGATSQSYDPQVSGDYQVQITDANGCSSISDIFAFTGSGIGTTETEVPLRIFPIPSNGILNIDGIENPDGISVSFYNTCGVLVFREANSTIFDLSILDNGVYFMTIQRNNTNLGHSRICIIK